MKKSLHAIMGCIIGLHYPTILWYTSEEYVQLLSRFLGSCKNLFIYLLLIPYIMIKFMNITVLMIKKRTNSTIKEAFKIIVAMIIFILLMIRPLELSSNYRFQLISTLLSHVDSVIGQYTYEVMMFATMLYGIIFSIIPDNKYSNTSPFHSIIVILLISMSMWLIGSTINLLRILVVLFPLFLLCTILHIMVDLSSSEGAMILYPLYRKVLLKDFLKGRKRILKLADDIGKYLCLFTSAIFIVLFIMNLSDLYTINLGHVYSLLLSYFITACIPLPLLLLAKTHKKRYTVKPIRCNSCGRIIPPKSSTCPYCGEKV